ncbi:MAG: hypothetical protein AAGI66_04165 [Cyanobacteria bacterium P01_H01_bin.74]
MTQSHLSSENLQNRPVVLIFLKGLASPVVLYTDDCQKLQTEIKLVIQSANSNSPQLVEKMGNGPLRHVAFLDTAVLGVAIQYPMDQAFNKTA